MVWRRIIQIDERERGKVPRGEYTGKEEEASEPEPEPERHRGTLGTLLWVMEDLQRKGGYVQAFYAFCGVSLGAVRRLGYESIGHLVARRAWSLSVQIV